MGRKKKPKRPRGHPDYLGYAIPLLLADIHPRGASVKDIRRVFLFTRQAIYATLKRLKKEGIIEDHLTKRPTIFRCIDEREARTFAVSRYNEIYPPQANNKQSIFRSRFKELQRQHDALPLAYQGVMGLVERVDIGNMKVIGMPNMLDLDGVDEALRKIKKIKGIAYSRAKIEKKG